MGRQPRDSRVTQRHTAEQRTGVCALPLSFRRFLFFLILGNLIRLGNTTTKYMIKGWGWWRCFMDSTLIHRILRHIEEVECQSQLSCQFAAHGKTAGNLSPLSSVFLVVSYHL
ncbi:hypothetical protein AAHE18_18G154200 [Arachis hypogaea]